MASADFSQFVVTAADGTACETSRDKSSVFPRLPARFTRLGYGCLLDFAVLRQLIRQTRLISGFCSSGYDFAIPSSRLHLTVQTLGVALGFVGNYAPYGLSPQTDGMPVIRKDRIPALPVYGLYFIIRPAAPARILFVLWRRRRPDSYSSCVSDSDADSVPVSVSVSVSDSVSVSV